MIYKIIGVFDALIQRALPIQCVGDMPDEDIIESHRRAVIMKKIPEDLAVNYVLFRYGSFNDESGDFDLESKPVKLCSLADFIPGKKQVDKPAEVTSNVNN